MDDRNEKIGRKIRDNELKRVPYMVIVGEKEAAEGLVSMRQQGGGEQATMTMEAFADRINAEVADSFQGSIRIVFGGVSTSIFKTRIVFSVANVSKKLDSSNDARLYLLRILQSPQNERKFAILENLTRLFKDSLFAFSAFLPA